MAEKAGLLGRPQSTTKANNWIPAEDELWNNEPRAHSVQAADLVEFILNRRDV